MKYQSTRNPDLEVTLEQAIMSGTAPDGGLYIPSQLPSFDMSEFDGCEDLPSIAEKMLTPFFQGSVLEGDLASICSDALDVPAPLTHLDDEAGDVSVLELFHGPTAAFKDFGARFLAACMSRIVAHEGEAARPVTVIVATSGDTGGAVAAAFHQRPGTRVVVLFPEGRVSPRQQHQLTCWGDNILSFSVRGEFDDCQHLAKSCFADENLSAAHRLCSANSINVGRLLPQASYYAATSLAEFRRTGEISHFVIPTGNLGNAFACVWARSMGFPIGDIHLVTNANRTIPDFLGSGNWEPRSSVATLASAMDVGNPSNMERLRELIPDIEDLRNAVSSSSVTDDEIREQIVAEYQRHGLAWCPHTATAFRAWREMSDEQREGRRWILVATAHAAKFESIVEPLLGAEVDVPEELARLLELPAEFETIDPAVSEIASRLTD